MISGVNVRLTVAEGLRNVQGYRSRTITPNGTRSNGLWG